MSLRLPDIPHGIASRLGLQNLPAFQDQMRIFMHPQQLVLVRTRRNSTRQIMDKKIVSCMADDSQEHVAGNLVEHSVTHWSPAIRALANTLREECWRGANPQLVLSSHFVRYALIPWNGALANQSERDAFLRHNFLLTYGDAARGWDLRVSHNGVSQAALVSGIEPVLLQELQQVFSIVGFKLSAIYPHLMIAINHAQQQLTDATYWFVVVEEGRACIAMIREGQWISVKSFAVTQEPSQQIAASIARESIICSIDTSDWPLAVYWPGRVNTPMLQVDGRKVVWVKPGDAAYAMPGSLNLHPATNYAHPAAYDAVMWA